MKITFSLILLAILNSCALSKNNKFLSCYKEVNTLSEIEKTVDLGLNYYPDIKSFANSEASLNEYQRLKSDGYVLLGYSMFHHEGKMSEGLAIQTGKKLGAHLILISRARSNSGALDNQELLEREQIKGPAILEALIYKPNFKKGNASLSYFHSVLFLVQLSME